MITIRNLSKSFGLIKALDDLSITVEKGEIYGFIGRNGAGKSTTMNIIAGLSKPNQGTCIINGIDINHINHPSELNIGYLPENPQFLSWLTAYETLKYLTPDLDTKEGHSRIADLLKWVGLDYAKNRRVGGFSRGMKQRLGMACALVHNPELLILDEPSSALDPEGRSDVLSLILDLKKQGKTIILSTHILSDIERVCDRIGLINDGRLLLEKSLSELKNDFSKPILDVELETELSDKHVNELRHIQSVSYVEANRNHISIYLECMDAVKGVMKEVINLDSQVIGMNIRRNTLEDLFIREVNGK